jgi:hypothetical protein
MVRLIACIYFLLVFQGCGKQKFPDYDEKPERQEEQAPGYYTGVFTTLNSRYAGSVSAHAVLWTKGQQFYGRVVMMKGTPSVIYHQFIHKGRDCPTMKNDYNHDGMLSADEAAVVAGPMLIPLDRNLKTQVLGMEWFPRTDREGLYYYSRSGDISEMMKDLRKLDYDPARGLGKLNINENLDIDQRTIILYRLSSESFIPVACTELKEDIEREE